MYYLPLLITCTRTTTVAIIALFLLAFAFILYKYGKFYIKSLASDIHVSFLQMIAMTLRGVDINTVVECRVMAKKSGIDIASSSLESHCLSGGNIKNVVRAIVAASHAKIELGFDRACAIDLSGRDVFDAVRTSINPKVWDYPDPTGGCPALCTVTQDGIQLKVKIRITLRTKIERLIGGANEETVIGRISEAVIATINSSENYKKVLENPDAISKAVMEKILDGDTAFQVLSVNIVEMKIGDNIGAKLQAEQSETDKRLALVEAEKRQGMATARFKEMEAVAEENRAKILAADAEVPKAIAQAFREGNLGIMDYYHIKNTQADTEMRMSSSKTGILPPAIK